MAFTKITNAGFGLTTGTLVGVAASFSSTVSVGGTLTYEDVTNVDSVGLITARNGIEVTDKGVQVGTGATVDSAGDNILTFLTNGNERIRIDSSGTAEFTSNLAVSGSELGSRTLRIQDSTTDNAMIYGDNSGSVSIQGGASQPGSGITLLGKSASTDPGTIKFFTTVADNNIASAERMRLDSSGRLLVGATTAATAGSLAQYATFVLRGDTGGSASAGIINLARGVGAASMSAGNSAGNISFSDNAGLEFGDIGIVADAAPSGSSTPGRFILKTTASGATTPTERLRIDSSGRLLLGTTSAAKTYVSLGLQGNGASATNQATIALAKGALPSGADQELGRLEFVDNSGNSGSTIVAISNAAWTSGSSHATDLVFSTTSSGASSVTERMRITSAGFLGLNTSSPATDLHISGSSPHIDLGPQGSNLSKIGFASLNMYIGTTSGSGEIFFKNNISSTDHPQSSGTLLAMITNDKKIIVGKSSAGANNNGSELRDGAGGDYAGTFSASGHVVMLANRNTDDGVIIRLRGQGNDEGSISVSGSTVSYNGAHLARWSQLPGGAARTEILRGSVLSNLDEMCEWGEEDNEQLNRMKISDVEGDRNVSGVFQDWDDDDDTYTNDFYCAMTGDFVIRIAQGTTVARGDLLMSAGDGTAKPQDDDIVRSKTIAKVTSTTVSTTYSDGSYCVPCVLMAC